MNGQRKWGVYTTERHSAIKKKDILPIATATWMAFELSEIGQILYDFTTMWDLWRKKRKLIEKDQICGYQRSRVGGSCQVNPTHSYHKAKKKKSFLWHLYEMRDVNLLCSSHYAIHIKLMQSACWFCLNEAKEKKKKKSKKSAHTLSTMWGHRRPSSTSPGRGLCLEPQSQISDFQSPEHDSLWHSVKAAWADRELWRMGTEFQIRMWRKFQRGWLSRSAKSVNPLTATELHPWNG